MIIRPETASDIAAIRSVIGSAFGGEQETGLVDSLRRDGDLVLSLVAEQDGHLVGHIGFSRLWIGKDAYRFPGISLAPLAVVPAYQRKGTGRALVEAGHALLRDGGETIAFVLGDAAYYGRFGYSPAIAAAFDCVYAGPHFQALRFLPLAPNAGLIEYAPAFDELG